MIEADEGHIVTIASVAGLLGRSLMVPYCSTKHAVVGLTDGLRNELALLNSNVKATCIMLSSS